MTDAEELVAARVQREQFDRNCEWLRLHSREIYARHRGQCICIAGQELFVAETAGEALRQAMVAHPEDKGRFVHYIPVEKVPRVYAN